MHGICNKKIKKGSPFLVIVIYNTNNGAMHSDKYYDDPMPELIPLQRKVTPSQVIGKQAQETFRSKAEESKNVNEGPATAPRENPILKVPEMDRVASKKMDETIKRKQYDLYKRNEVSKNLINQMINKISLRSIAEENYPISNETIQKLLLQLEEEIAILTVQVGKFENSLLLNPTNQHIKKQLQGIEKSLNQIKTIKELYQEKIDNRSKISELQSKIMDLKSENRELKIKIARGIEKIQSHIHNLPCQKEKQLIEQVNKYKLSLNREKEMRQNLESNISSIVLNFKRFYVEADDARKIVTDQLKGISQKEHQLNIKLQNINHQKKNLTAGSMDVKSIKMDSNIASSEIFMRERRLTNRISDEENMAEIINQINMKEREKDKEKELKLERIEEGGRKARDRSGVSQLGSTILNKQGSETSRGHFTLEEQIEKMRTNQKNFKKIAQRK